MQREDLMFVGTCDLAGHVRGKAFPAVEWDSRLGRGVGYTHSNIMMSAFGPIYHSDFGTAGDLAVVPDPSTRVDVPFPPGAGEHFCLGDLRTLDGASWTCCPRHFCRRGLQALQDETGLQLLATFEQEFVYTGVEHRPGRAYALDTLRQAGTFGEAAIAAIRAAGVTPDSFLPEYGPRQFEVTVAPTLGLRAADEAVIVREMLRAVAQHLEQRVILSPMVTPDGVGNGTHVHFSLRTATGEPAMHDTAGQQRLSVNAAHFVAGLLHHLPALSALTAPSVASYLRLTPNRWAPTHADLGVQDRGSAVRICPVFATAPDDVARLFNVEYRVADAAASPYMVLGAIAHAGLDGIRRGLALPGADAAPLLPRSLGAALDALRADAQAAGWLGGELLDAYTLLKRDEIAALDGMDDAAICARYAETY
jgi:glutamine synthetase